MLLRRPGTPRFRLSSLMLPWAVLAACALEPAPGRASLQAQEIRGLAKLDSRGDAVWGANVTLMDSLGRETAATRTNRRGEFVVKAPAAGTYWLQLSARTVGRNASPVFVLDSGMTLNYEHVFRQSLSARVRGEDFSAQSVLTGPFLDSTSGRITRGVSTTPVRQVRVTVLDARNEAPIARAEVALVAIDPRFSQVVGGGTDTNGTGGWRDVQQTWYRVVARRIGFEPGGTLSFPIVGEADSVDVVLRLQMVTVLDPITVMEQRITAFGFNLDLMSRFYLGGMDLLERNPSARSVDDLITSLRIPGLSIATGDMTSVLRYRGQRVRVFILDGTRTSGELPLVEPGAVESLMFVPPQEAGAIFGPDASGGVLIINTRASRQPGRR
ncbi:MAG: TonB-dependent receptor [Gemmatimonadaceae bacterium]|nr:TonB-dependent receptor [Gemmatimonadaceae bacterium]